MKEFGHHWSDRQRGKILVVEDDVATAFEIPGTLEAHAFQVTHVTTGLKALDCLASSEYDATTLDRMLPDTDGVTVVRSLRKAKRNETARGGRAPLQHKGETTSWRDAMRRHRREGVEGHTFLFGLSDGTVIDGSRGGNSAR